MTPPGARLLAIARAGGAAVWVRVERTRGSAPREPGASMVVGAEGTPEGTIGGGHLEFDAIAHARRMLARGERMAAREVVLGAALGQCCGGVVTLSLRRVDARERDWLEALAALEHDGGTLWLASRADAATHDDLAHTVALRAAPAAPVKRAEHASVRPPSGGACASVVSRIDAAPWPVWVFGAGHVGEAVVRVLATLPADVVWVDPRDGSFPRRLPANVVALESDSPAHEVGAIPAGADVLVMTHSHALDFDLCAALLAREDLGEVGLIGSATKAASFRARLARRGLSPARIASLRCPIGSPPEGDAERRPLDRHPGAIAVAVAHALWSRRRAAHAAAPRATEPPR